MSSIEDRPLLPNEPRQLDWKKEGELTQRFLVPIISELEQLLLQMRAELDPVLSALQPTKAGKPYPLGQCLEISLAMKDKLQQQSVGELHGTSAIAFSAIQQFSLHGGAIRQIWGDLRGEYFQNAFLFGDLYVDVSNDTVVSTKPKVEILPFFMANLSAIRDFHHFGRLVERYWKAQAFPNFLFPELAPYAPVLIRYADGSVQLHDASDYMVTLATSSEFTASENYLATAPISLELLRQIIHVLQIPELNIASTAEQGRQASIAYCQSYRAEGRNLCTKNSVSVVNRIIEINQDLSQHMSAYQSTTNSPYLNHSAIRFG